MARLLRAACRTLVAAGLLVLLFVAYQLWGTSIRTAQAQRDLDAAFAERLEAAVDAGAVVRGTDPDDTSTTDAPATSPKPGEPVDPLPPELLPTAGDDAGRIEIPTIGLDWTFVEGVSVDDLKRGPGHYPETPWPGQANNAALAGHRTTYGQPFHDLDRLEPGDDIIVTTIQGRFAYEVRETVLVDPHQVEVLGPDYWDFDGDPSTLENSLTLTACHPKFSASQRIVVAAELLGPPAPPTQSNGATSAAALTPDLDAGLSGEHSGAWPAVVWGLIVVIVGVTAWIVGRRRPGSRWRIYAVGVVPFMLALFFFFENFSTLLPANY